MGIQKQKRENQKTIENTNIQKRKQKYKSEYKNKREYKERIQK